MGFSDTVFPSSVDDTYDIATYCSQLAELLDRGVRIPEARKTSKDSGHYPFVQLPAVVGDKYTRMVHVYFYAGEWASVEKTTLLNSWFYYPAWQGNPNWPQP